MHFTFPLHPIYLIFSFMRRCFINDLFPSGYVIKILYAFLISPMLIICPSHLILLDLIILLMLGADRIGRAV
jgi:hypothetical protein